MLTHPLYQRLAGSNLDRVAALSDGVFAIAMTLLVLELKVPPHTEVHNEVDLLTAIAQTAPHFATYAMSFITLAIFWSGQQAQLNALAASDRPFSLIQIGFLAGVGLLPFSTSLLGEYMELRTALLVYWFNLAVMGAWLYVGWRYANRTKLTREDLAPEMAAAVETRIIRAQTLYAIGAALCVVSTYLSIAAIVVVQLIYAFGPRTRLIAQLVR